MIKPEHLVPTRKLSEGLRDASVYGILDELVAYVANPQSINDFCDAVESFERDVENATYRRQTGIIK